MRRSKFFLLWFNAVSIAALWQAGQAVAQNPSLGGPAYDPANGLRISDLWPEGQQREGVAKYFVIWRGKPSAFPLRVQAGWDRDSFPPDEPGIRVRARAFDQKGRPSGQINGPGTSDDTFKTKQKCSFTPSKPGQYKITLEWLNDKGQPLPQWDQRDASYRGVTFARTTSLLVYQAPPLQAVVVLSGWKAVAGQKDLYQRDVGISWKNNVFTPKGYSYSVDRSDVPRRRAVKLWVAPVFPVKGLENVSWLSSSQVRVNLMFPYTSDVTVQYFRYDPLRDTPRELGVYRVKAQVLP